MLAVSGLNHITLAVSKLDRSFDFYVHLLGLKPHARWTRGAYISTANLWLCLSVDNASPAQDYTHLALTINSSDLSDWENKLLNAGIERWKENTSEGESLYFLDPDHHKLELHVGDLDSRLRAIRNQPYNGLELF
ncbi:MAG: VOC family protein [Granulosicoccus sp.]